jgi:hypothetical protein
MPPKPKKNPHVLSRHQQANYPYAETATTLSTNCGEHVAYLTCGKFGNVTMLTQDTECPDKEGHLTEYHVDLTDYSLHTPFGRDDKTTAAFKYFFRLPNVQRWLKQAIEAQRQP